MGTETDMYTGEIPCEQEEIELMNLESQGILKMASSIRSWRSMEQIFSEVSEEIIPARAFISDF